MKYCPACGAPVEHKVPEGDSLPRHVCSGCEAIHYQNPRVIVGAVVEHTLDDGRAAVLLCRRAIQPRRGLWTLPAGFMELGETIAEGAAREVREEAVVEVSTGALLSIYSLTHIDQVQIFFCAKVASGQAAPGPESLEVGWFPWDEIPWESLAFPTVHWALTYFREHAHKASFAPELRQTSSGPE